MFWIAEVSAARKKWIESCQRGDSFEQRLYYLKILDNVIRNMKDNMDREGRTFGQCLPSDRMIRFDSDVCDTKCTTAVIFSGRAG